MKKGQIVLVAAAVLAVLLFVVLGSAGDDDPSASGSGDRPAAGALEIELAFSPEKAPLLTPLAERFNASRTQVDGRPVFVRMTNVASGEAEDRIRRGTLRPTVWSPASSLWGRLLNFTADRPIVARDNPSIVRTPLVIAMWEPMARALGWPRRQPGWADVLRLARSPKGWASVGHPEFGRFKLVHTNPDFSTAGLSAVVAEYQSATGKREGLTVADVSGKAREAVRAIERSIVHYGDTTLFIADQLRRKGQGYASAVAMEEATLVDFNLHRGQQPRMVAIYPAEGTFYSDNPFAILDAEWVTPQQRRGAEAFQRFLAREITPQVAAAGGFRVASTSGESTALPAPLTAANGVDARQPTRVLGLPEPRVLNTIKQAWREDRKPANIAVVVDTSGSMGEEGRMASAKEGLREFLKQVSTRDRIALVGFSDRIRTLVPLASFGENRTALNRAIGGLVPDGGTAVYDATEGAFRALRAEGERASDRINAVVLLTDGQDTDSRRSAAAVEQLLAAQGDSANQVRVFTIAYSAGAVGAKETLERFAVASGGKAYTGDVDDITSVYRSISSFF